MTQDTKKIDYNVNTLKKIAKFFLGIMVKVLPLKLFTSLYNSIRTTYQFFGRFIYFTRVRILSIFADKEDNLKYDLTKELLPFTMGGWKAMHNAFETVSIIEKMNVFGAIVECGVARGGTSAMMAVTNRKLGKKERVKWLFDSYEGLPNPGPQDFKNGKVGELISPLGVGDCIGTEIEVRDLMINKLKFDESNVKFVKGWFENTVPRFKKKIGPIAILRLDGDWYESTKIPLENFYDQITINGIIIVDDYATCYGSQKALDEFMEVRDLDFSLNPDGRGGAWFQKKQIDT